MAKKTQLNQMSKKQILQSLAYQQQQDYATINRMLVALARSLNVDPATLAKNFVDQEGNRSFAQNLNSSLDELYEKAEAEAQAQASADEQAGEQPEQKEVSLPVHDTTNNEVSRSGE